MSLIFRRATDDDAQQVFDLVNAAYQVETGDSGVAFKHTNRFISLDESHRCIANGLVLAIDPTDNALVGCVCVTRPDPALRVADMGPLAVDQSRQGRGLGSKIIAEAVRRARDELDCDELEITVVNHRSDLFPYYEKIGFRRVGEAPFRDTERITRPCHFVVMRLPVRPPTTDTNDTPAQSDAIADSGN
jgi:predicted N-acetyltransferase YhbS